jgi:hypothetical protein
VRSLSLMTAAVGLGALLASACSGQNSSFVSTEAPAQGGHPPHASATATPIPYHFQTVDDPSSSTNAVTGINQLRKIVGVYGAGSASNIPESYTAVPPYTQFRAISYPGQGTYATSLTSNKIIAGYVIQPTSLSGTWSFVRIKGLYTLLEDSNEGAGSNAVTEILGINDSELAVGFYTNNSGTKIPFELDVPTQSYTDLSPPGAMDAEATGINGKGNISGWETTSKGTVAFYLQAGTYYPTSHPGTKDTYALSLNWQDQLCGYYLDASRKAHGFVLTGPTRGGRQQFWQTIDEPNEASGTWVTSINNYDDITGYYVDANGVQHGFVATPQ